MTWLAPEIEVTVGDKTRLASMQEMKVVASRSQPIATAYIELSNVRFEWNDGAEDGDDLVLRWGYRGHGLSPLFDGTVKRAHLQETLKVWGLCRARALSNTRVTRTYHDEAADAVVNHLVAGLGFQSLDIASCDTVIDKLPLRDNTVVEAIQFLNRRLELDHAFYADPSGGFHWESRDETQEPSHTFIRGDDVLDLQSLPGGRILLTVMGVGIWHSETVMLAGTDGTETRYFVEQVVHTVGQGGRGIRSHLLLIEVGDG